MTYLFYNTIKSTQTHTHTQRQTNENKNCLNNYYGSAIKKINKNMETNKGVSDYHACMGDHHHDY